MSERRRDKVKAFLTGASSKIGPGSMIYSGLRTSLTLLKEMADASELPALKGVVGGLLMVVEMIERMSQNQDDAAELLGYLNGLQNMLKGTHISDSLAGRMKELSQEMAKIVDDIQKMNERSTLSRLMRNERDASILTGLVQSINHLLFKFLLGSSVAIEIQTTAAVQGIGRIEGNISKIGQDIKRLQHLLQDGLPRVVEARFDGDSRQRCLEGTRVALLNTVQEWSRQEVSIDGKAIPSIFWLCGQAGTGKTTIASSVAKDCHDRGRLGASFFFSRDHSDRNNIKLVFPTLAHQLGTFCDEFKTLLTEILKKDPDLAYIDPPDQLEKLIVEPLKSCVSFPPGTIIVIDALDECKDNGAVSTLLSMLSNNLSRLPQLKFFITSRPENSVRLGFEPLCEITQSLILHDVEASVVDADIEHYLRSEFPTASRLYPDLVQQGWPGDEAIMSLVQKSCRLFIFAATSMKFIMDVNYRHPPKQLRDLLEQTQGIKSSSSMPPAFFFLDRLYLQVLDQAFPEPTSPSLLTLVKMLLGTIVLLRNPLSPEALEDFMRLQVDRGIVRTTLRYLHSVIVVPDTDEHAIRLIHPSFFDFLTSRCSDPRFRIDSTFYHEQLGILCFEQMKALKRDICEIKDESKLNEEIEDLQERVKRYISPALRYACLHWEFHLCSAGESALLCGMLKGFCHNQLLYWIEVLSLTDSLRDGIRRIRAVLHHLSKFSFIPEELLGILKDTVLFIPEYFELITSASLQIYRSALPLSPLSSSLRKTFVHELKSGVRILQGAQKGNHSGVTILRGHSKDVESAGFSPDCTLVFSTSCDEVRLWDRDTGTLLKTFKVEFSDGYYYRGLWATFLPNGDRIIAGTEHGTVYIWDVTTGVCLDTFELEGMVTRMSLLTSSYICSPDATRIDGSFEGEVLSWDLSNGSLVNTLQVPDKCTPFAFSPNRKLIATTSTVGCNIRLWDAVSGAALQTLTGHSGHIPVVAFSQCSKYLVSCSYDTHLRLWDSTSGDALKVFKGHSGWVISVAFSPNNKQIISASCDKTLRVWDVDKGKLVKTLSVGGEVYNVGFSFDGTHYIYARERDIYIWDADRAADSDRSTENLINLKFSPDGTYLIGSIEWESDIHLWNGLTGAPLKILQGHSISVSSLAFSPNNKYIVSGSRDRTIRVWDVASKKTIKTLKGVDGVIKSIAFSPDSTQILSTCCHYHDEAQIWDSVTGKNLFTININININSAATEFPDGGQIIDSIEDIHNCYAKFSPDGSQIIAGARTYDIPPHICSHPVPLNHPVTMQLQYSLEGGWIFASRGAEKERCIWIPVDWREDPIDMSSKGRVAIGGYHDLVLLDLSGIRLSI